MDILNFGDKLENPGAQLDSGRGIATLPTTLQRPCLAAPLPPLQSHFTRRSLWLCSHCDQSIAFASSSSIISSASTTSDAIPATVRVVRSAPTTSTARRRGAGRRWRHQTSRRRRRWRPRDAARISDIYILHELLADGANLLGERSGEHHDLLLVRRHPEDVLHVTAHVCKQRNTWVNT